MDIQRRMKYGDWIVRLKGSKSSTRRRRRSSSRSHDSKGFTEDSSSSSHKEKRKRRYRNNSRDEFKKEKPPTFNGEINTRLEVEAWILGMRKYFQVQDYSGNTMLGYPYSI